MKERREDEQKVEQRREYMSSSWIQVLYSMKETQDMNVYTERMQRRDNKIFLLKAMKEIHRQETMRQQLEADDDSKDERETTVSG